MSLSFLIGLRQSADVTAGHGPLDAIGFVYCCLCRKVDLRAVLMLNFLSSHIDCLRWPNVFPLHLVSACKLEASIQIIHVVFSCQRHQCLSKKSACANCGMRTRRLRMCWSARVTLLVARLTKTRSIAGVSCAMVRSDPTI